LKAALLRETIQMHQQKLQRRALGMFQSFSSGLLAKSLARSFNTWRRLTSHKSAQMVERSRQEAVQTHVLRLMMSNIESEAPRLIYMSWSRWKKVVHHEKLRLKSVYVRMLEIATLWLKQRHQDQRTALRRWNAMTVASRLSQGERRLRVRAALLVLVSIARRNLTRAWHTWSSIVDGNHVKKVLATRVSTLKNACVVANMRFSDIVQVCFFSPIV
jgi:hypothetical protein